MRFLHCVLVILLAIENPYRFSKSSNNDIQFDMLYLPFQLTVQCLLDLQHKRKRVHFGLSCFFPFWIPKMNPFYWVVSGVAWAQYQSKVWFFFKLIHSLALCLTQFLSLWMCVFCCIWFVQNWPYEMKSTSSWNHAQTFINLQFKHINSLRQLQSK